MQLRAACCDKANKHWEVGSGCHKRFYRHMSFWFIYTLPGETPCFLWIYESNSAAVLFCGNRVAAHVFLSQSKNPDLKNHVYLKNQMTGTNFLRQATINSCGPRIRAKRSAGFWINAGTWDQLIFDPSQSSFVWSKTLSWVIPMLVGMLTVSSAVWLATC